LHDGEQVAVGFPAPLSVAAASDQSSSGSGGGDLQDATVAALAAAVVESPAVAQVDLLLRELGRWRPWTVVSTSLPRWRATTSVLIWEIGNAADGGSVDVDAAVEGFYELVRTRAEHGAELTGTTVINLAAAAARRAELTVDRAQLTEPVVRVVAEAAVAPPK
jgi:hypothetical protein